MNVTVIMYAIKKNKIQEIKPNKHFFFSFIQSELSHRYPYNVQFHLETKRGANDTNEATDTRL